MKKLTNEQINARIESAMESTKKDTKSATMKLNYDAKAVKIDFDGSKEFKVLMCKHYTESKYYASVMDFVSNNTSFYKKQLSAYLEKETLTDEDNKEIDSINENMAIITACARAFRKGQNKVINELCNAWNFEEERVLKAYLNRGADMVEWKNALGAFFAQYGITMSESLFNHIHTHVGSKSATSSMNLKGEFLQGYKGKALYKLLMDIMVDLAIRKGKIAWSIIDQLKGEKLVEIKEFSGYICIKALTVKSTVAEIKATLDNAGVDYAGKTKKADLMEVYRKAVKDGAIVEY